jgi:proteic killer suppression protein
VIRVVRLTTRARKDLVGVPIQVQRKFATWVLLVQNVGLEAARKVKGFHDEPLKGDRKGQRSIRLNKAYRAIYVVVNGSVKFAEVREVNNHDY